MNKLKTAAEKLLEAIPEELHKEGYSFGDASSKDLIRVMKEYAEQFIDLAAKQATTKTVKIEYTGVRAGGFYTVEKVDKESILKVKQLIK